MYKIIISILIICSFSACSNTKDGGFINTHRVDNLENIAIKGFDTVAYFKEQKPVQGSSKFLHKWNGATWFFSSNDNKDLFINNPEKYAPQYGGYCAYGIAVPQQKIDIDPQAWHITNGKLYLNYTIGTQKLWLEDKYQLIIDADNNWSEVRTQ